MGGGLQLRRLVGSKGVALGADVGVNFVLPYLIYSYAAPQVGDVQALLASSVPPILWSIVEFVRHRRIDALSMMVLVGIILSILAFFGGGGVRMLQLREKLVSGVIGLAFLLSAVIGRPLIYELGRASMARQDKAEAERFEGLRDDPLVRRTLTIMTIVWGLGLILDVAIGVALLFVLTIKQYMIVNPIASYGTMGLLSLWTLWYRGKAKARNQRIRATTVSAPAEA